MKRGAATINERLAASEGLRRYWADPERRARMRATALQVWADPELRERHRLAGLAAAAEEGIPMTDWTAGMVARLRAEWAAGTPKPRIAVLLEVSPYALDGKARRLKLQPHALAPRIRSKM